MPKENRKGKASSLTSDQIDRIIALASSRYEPIFAIAAYTGCRISEALTRKVKHLDMVSGSITFTETKTKIDRTVPISAKLRSVLEKSHFSTSSEDWLFPSPKTVGHVTRVSVGEELKAICDDLGYVGVSTHSFRRSLATTLHDKGTPLKTIASVTGHRSLDSLARYIDVTPAQQKAAVDLL